MSDRASAAVSKATGTPDPLIGRLINDRFKISALIARGGMGKVYRAEQAPLGRVCAIKVLNPNYAGEHDPEFHKRFVLEASIASKLTHPNTVTIFDYGRTDDDIYYMAMEYLEGHTLHRAIREAGHFPEERAAHVARQICRALREAHSLGVIHRDLKPANIFLVEHGDETDFVKVLDFGLVKNVSENKGEDLTQTGLFMGSPKYMAPEQIRGDRVDARTDIYALGIIMYEMITGKVPFDRPNSVNILMAHVNEEAPALRVMNPNIQISPQIEETIGRCMAKDVDTRFRSMDEVLAALKRVGGGTMTATISGVGATGEYRSMAGSGGRPAATSIPANGSSSGPQNAAFLSPSASDPGVIPSPLLSPSDSASVPIVSQSQRSGSKGLLLFAVVGVVAVVGAAAFFAMKGNANPIVTGPTGSSGANPTTTTPAGGPATQQTTVADPTAPTPTATAVVAGLVKVRLNSDPDGASVKEEGIEICNSTPCDVPYKGPEADPTREHKLTFSKSGFKTETKSFKVGDSPISVKLTKQQFVAVPGEKKDPPAAMPGYKGDIPY
jgi:serine/threonine-protein kinase